MATTRIEYLDRARAMGIFLVYYGHFVAALVGVSANDLAATQWKLIYSFHVPLFFFLAGVFWKPNPKFLQVVSEKFRIRLLPIITFSLLLVPFWLTLMPSRFWKLLALPGFYLQGMPLLNLVTWFLACLFTVELMAALTVAFSRVTPLNLVLYSTIFFVIGLYVFVQGLARADGFPGLLPRFLHLEDALIMLTFFFAGYLVRDLLALWAQHRAGLILGVPIFLIAGYVVLKTYQLNQDAGRGVLVIASIYGNPIWLLVTAFAGIIFILALSRFLAVDFAVFRFVSQNSLIYLGLNGLNFHFLDDAVARAVPINQQSHLAIFLFVAMYVVMIMLMYAPVVLALRRWFPQLVGYPWTSTSLLPPSETWYSRKVVSHSDLI